VSAAAPFYFARMRLTFAPLLVPVLFAACTPDAAECAAPADCGDVEDAPCERCPAIASSVCVEGACTEVGAADVDVTATFLIDRDLDGVNGMAWAIAVADRPCAAFTAFAEDLNVVASGQKTLSGGDFHPDVQLAPVPAGDVLVMALATSQSAGEGDVLGSGCVEATAEAPSLAVAQLDLQ
jgi:hypothetical protein